MSFEATRLFTTLIDRLSDVPGVVATAAFDASGGCLACFVGDALSPMGAGRVIPVLQELAAPTAPGERDAEGVTFVERHLVRVLVRRTADATLIALIEPDADVDLVVAHLARASDQVARASKPPPPLVSERPPEAQDGTSGFFARDASALADVVAAARASSPSPSPALAERVVDPLVLERLRTFALEALGFGAEVAFEAARLAVTNLAGQVPRARWVELVGRLAAEIDDDGAREDFVTRAIVLPSRIKESDALDLLSPLARWVVERRAG